MANGEHAMIERYELMESKEVEALLDLKDFALNFEESNYPWNERAYELTNTHSFFFNTTIY